MAENFRRLFEHELVGFPDGTNKAGRLHVAGAIERGDEQYVALRAQIETLKEDFSELLRRGTDSSDLRSRISGLEERINNAATKSELDKIKGDIDSLCDLIEEVKRDASTRSDTIDKNVAVVSRDAEEAHSRLENTQVVVSQNSGSPWTFAWASAVGVVTTLGVLFLFETPFWFALLGGAIGFFGWIAIFAGSDAEVSAHLKIPERDLQEIPENIGKDNKSSSDDVKNKEVAGKQ